ncbi:kinesin domain-containing protein [Suillus subaureus]|uniref:Kinesin domain-containing protein n=1 Tax=Suillus subaureus TaxID=48587 RepID=A0A9P7EP81_9AGAM|nr:kinesin domain-containing protein [Suillus subaureus]KAG1826831.1 kinesin domain-containing protein [Suillus subaureus]
MAPSSSSSSSGASTSVQVALRIRPTTTQDTVSIPARFQRTVIHGTSSTSVTVDASAAAPTASGSATAVATPSTAAGKKQVFTFDQVHPPTVTQHSLFTSTAQPLISRFMEGFNCTILAYGQTSSGKTFTMTGVDLDADPSDPNNGMGIIPRAVSTIFSQARKLKEQRGGTWNYSIKGSFIEVYNEDLIDLLSSDEATGLRREVQIREGKDGSIIWGGLREVTVRNSTEVMHLIRQGTAIRRTNETDMNAQSSRSHAIFSLTLTQKKYTGSGVPPRSSSPLPPGGRSPSRLARPGSLYTGGSSPNARVSSPTMGRPSTPSFQAAMGRGGGLRPASSLGLRPPDNRQDDDEGGEWTTIVSKFHFVDLAGSERLKRTAAAGERIKEGISINSGLLALGNVISALGDPSRAKSHTNSHVPYRDSKLTRLLQDSLGGNAHTLMIACVSPTEWNIGETVNTLKYANRARNIKNRAIVNEREDGWDDIEWLQGTVTRLRKEVKQLKEGGTITSSTSPAVGEVTEGNSKKILTQMTELQNNYESLREKYVERTEDLTRLRREVGERHRTSSGGTVGGTAKYEEIVGPVIEEYEKTISAMEAELGLNRAALRLTNDMMEEKEEELAQITERHSATELYVEELRTRLAKLTEREASTEAYVRDLEEKMKCCDETSMSSSESLTDLKREVSRYKEAESHSASYIADLEARLARSDESVLTLQQTIERLENDCERRREEVEALTTRLENLSQDGASWRTDLEARERKVKELEQKMEAWERKRKEVNEDRIRLGDVVGEVELAKRSLESLNGGSTKVNSPSASGASTPPTVDLSVENQLVALRQTHAATLIDLSSVSKKYQDALQEIADLAAQIQEAKLSNPMIPETSAVDKADTPLFRRRKTSSKSRDSLADPVYDAAGRRLFFRQAASVDSLHGRALLQSLPPSLSLSQELSSVRSREASISSHGSSGSVSHSPSHRPNLSISLSSVTGATTPSDQRSAVSMEKEIMRLQEVLREREAEISTLESSLNEKEQTAPTPVEPHALQSIEADDLTHLSPKTIQKFDAVRKSMKLHHDLIPDVDSDVPDNDVDESLDRLNELMLSMAQKESQHKELVDSLHGQLAVVQRAHDELTTLSRDQALNMSTELEGLRAKHHDDLLELEAVKQREAELLASIKIAQEGYAAELAGLKFKHEDALRAKGIEIEELISCLKDEHETSLDTLREQLSEASAALEKALKEHESAFGKLQAEHEEVLQRHSQEAKEILERTIEEHQHAIAKSKADHAEVLKSKDEQVATDLHRTEEEYYNALTKLRKDHADALQRQATEAAAMLERLREDHASELRMSEKARECSLSESESSRDSALRDLQDEHAAAVARKEAAYAEDVEKLKTEHARLLSNKEEDYRARREHLKSEHATAMAVLREESEARVEQLTKALARLEEDTAATVVKLREEHISATRVLTEQHAVSLLQITRGHDEEIARLKLSHTSELDNAVAKAQEEYASLLTSHAAAIANLESEHQMSLAVVQASLVATQEKHASDLQESRTASERVLAEERKRLATTVAGLEQEHSDERDALRKEQDRLHQELESHKVTILDVQEQNERGVLAERQRSQSAVTELEEKHSAERTTMRESYKSLAQELEAHKAAASDFVAVRAQYELAVSEQTTAMSSLETRLVGVQSEKVDLQAQITKLMAELEKTRSERATFIKEASKRESLVDELDKHRSLIAEMQENLQRVKDEKDNLQVEKNKQETALRDMQMQIARTPIAQETSTPRATPDRNISFTRINGMASKLPPPTPPPSMPPPPAPKTQESQFSLSTQSSTTSSKDSTDSSATSVASVLAPNGPQVDSKAIAAKLEDQAKYIDEQEVMIKTLNKQLSHCESDLATHMDLVSTLETSLSDSEKNLRKARMQATELARERDLLNSQNEGLRNELQEARREVVTVRKSIVEEKQSLESRLDEERRAKERARAQLDSRMEELQKRKSKFACL